MSIPGEMRSYPRTFRAGLTAVSGWTRSLRARAGGVALASLIAGGMLLGPGVAGAAARSGKQAESRQGEGAATPTSGGRPKKVSPYAIATRRHMHAAAEAGDRANPAAPVGPSAHRARFRKE